MNEVPGVGTRHRLGPLLQPQSIAVVGASTKVDSLGRFTLEQTLLSGFSGRIWAINPNYNEVLGVPCLPMLRDLPHPVEHVVLCVPNARIEEELHNAIAMGARSATIFASCYMPDDVPGNALTDRIRTIAREANFLICGANCLGFLNLIDSVRSTWFPLTEMVAGSIGLIVHSGSVFVSMTSLDPRLRFNYVVSSGQELTVDASEYLDFMLDQPSTRVVGLFLEAVRNPASFLNALEKAQQRQIPIVVLKVGRTEKSADLAKTHSGAIAGNNAAYEAVFAKYGVVRVDTMDEFSATLQVLSHPKPLGPGRGIIGIHDSGGQRGMAIDLAADLDVPYAEISEKTKGVLAENLDFGLAPVNPLDIWGTGNNFDQIFTNSFGAMLADPDTALGVLFSDIGGAGVMDSPWAELSIQVAAQADKPVFITQNISRSRNPQWLTEITHRGVPILDGTENALKACRHALRYRDFLLRPAAAAPERANPAAVTKWRRLLPSLESLSEAQCLEMFSDFGITVPIFVIASTEDELVERAASLRFPVALKTAAPGIVHKSDVGGVALNISDVAALIAAYRDMRARLGGEVIVAEMTAKGHELALGMVADDQFGPLMILASGGVFVEIFRDRRVALPPVNAETGRTLIRELKILPLLEGARGGVHANQDAAAILISRFSVMIAALGDLLESVDANPVIVSETGAVAVDGVVLLPKAGSA